MFCVFYAVLSVHCSLVAICWERAGLLALLYVMFSCVIVTFPCVVLGQVWYLIVSIPDFCLGINTKLIILPKRYPQSVDIQISIPAISSTTTLVSELTIIIVWLLVKEACIMWTNIWVSASSACIRLTYPYCKLQTIPSPVLTIICALVWASLLLTARHPNSLAFAVITSKEVVPWFERSDVTSWSLFSAMSHFSNCLGDIYQIQHHIWSISKHTTQYEVQSTQWHNHQAFSCSGLFC